MAMEFVSADEEHQQLNKVPAEREPLMSIADEEQPSMLIAESPIIEDQLPVTDNKYVEIERLESLNALVNERTGKLTWELQLDPGEKKINSFKYSVKYPKFLSQN